jgi:MFS family permease
LIRRERVAVSVAFLAFGIGGGSVIPRLPALKDHLHLTDGQVGLALLGISLGGITGALLSRLVIRRDARLFARLAVIALCVTLVGPGLAGSFGALMASFYLIGCCCGLLDVLVNAQGAQLERIEGRPLINGFHGFWSLGAVIGSAIAGVAAYLGLAPLTQFLTVGLIVAVASFWVLRFLPTYVEAPATVDARGAVSFAVLAVCVICFTGVIAEGGTADWSPLFLRELSHASAGLAAVGYTGFALAATVVRFRADLLTARTSRQTVARIGAGISVGGLVLLIALPGLPTAIIGFALVGMGTAVTLPLAFAAGANLSPTGTPLALVMASTYAGTIAGPPAIGALADHLGLRTAMAIPLLAAVVVLVLAGRLRLPQASPQMKRITASMPR